MKRIILYGHLRKKYGKSFKMSVKTPADAIRALWSNFPDFKQDVMAHKYYKVYAGANQLDEKGLILSTSSNVIKIIPVVAGGSKTFRLIAGAALLAIAFYNPIAGIALFEIAGSTVYIGSIAFGLGSSMVLGALLEFWIGTPESEESDDNKYFRGAGNYAALGQTIPLVYGEVMAGSRTISSRVNTVDVPGDFKSKQYGTVVDVISEGEIEGLVNGSNSIYLQDSPIRYADGTLNIEGSVYSFNPGTQYQNQLFTHGIIAAKGKDLFIDTSYSTALLAAPILSGTSLSLTLVSSYTIPGSQLGNAIKYFQPSPGSFIRASNPRVFYLSYTKNLDANKIIGKYFRLAGYDSRKDNAKVISVDTYSVSVGSSFSKREYTIGYTITTDNVPSKFIRPSKDGQVKYSSGGIFGRNPVFKQPAQTPENRITFFSPDTSEISEQGRGSAINVLKQGKNLPQIALDSGYTTGIIGPDESINRSTGRIVTSDGDIPIHDITDRQFLDNLGTFRELRVSLEVGKNTPITRRISDKSVDAINATVSIPHLSWSGKKGLSPHNVEYKFDIRQDGQPWKTVASDRIRAKITTEYRRSYLINLEGEGPWDLRMSKITDKDEDKDESSNKIYWAGYTEIKNAKLSYPNTSSIGLSFDSDFFNTIPTRAYHVRGVKIKVPDNYDPIKRTYSGVYWDGSFVTKYSNNPAWILYDIITENRYGLGEYIPSENIDKWALYEIGKYCDEMVSDGLGGQEPRYTLNTQILDSQQALNMIRSIGSVFRGSTFWGASSAIVFQDKPTEPSHIFTNSNVVSGIFNYSGITARSRKNDITISWNDPNNLYNTAYESVFDDDLIINNGTQKASAIALGCTSRSQAQRLGKWYLYSSNMDQEVITFATGLETLLVVPGDIIKVEDRHRQGAKFGGRIKDIGTSTNSYGAVAPRRILLDAPVELKKDDQYKIHITYGDKIFNRSILNNTGYTEDSIELSSLVVDAGNSDGVIEDVGEANSIWVISSDREVVTQLFRVIDVAEAKDQGATISGIQYNPDKYDLIEKNIAIEYKPTSLGIIPAAPKNIVMNENLYTTTDNLIKNRVTVSWDSIPNAYVYSFQWRNISTPENLDGGGSDWSPVHLLDLPSFDIDDAPAGTYQFRVGSRYEFNNAVSPLTLEQFEVFGKTAPPADVTNFRYRIVDAGVLFEWDSVDDVDIDTYRLDILDAAIAINGTKFNEERYAFTKGNSHLYPIQYNEIIHAASVQAKIRARDTSGNYSENDTTLEFNAPDLYGKIENFIVAENDNNVDISWTPKIDASEYIVRIGKEFKDSKFFWRGSTTNINKPFYADTGTITNFWIICVGLWGNRSSNTITSYKLITTSNNKNRYKQITTDFADNAFADTMNQISPYKYRYLINSKVFFNKKVVAINFPDSSYFYGYHKYPDIKDRVVTLNYGYESRLLDGLTWENSEQTWDGDIHKRPFIFDDAEKPAVEDALVLQYLNKSVTGNFLILRYMRFNIGDSDDGVSFDYIKFEILNGGVSVNAGSVLGNRNFIDENKIIGNLFISNYDVSYSVPIDIINFSNNSSQLVTDSDVVEQVTGIVNNIGLDSYSYINYTSTSTDIVTSGEDSYDILTPYISYKKPNLDTEIIDSISGNNGQINTYRGVGVDIRKRLRTPPTIGDLSKFGVTEYAGAADGELLLNKSISWGINIPQEFTVYLTFKNLIESKNRDSLITIIADATSPELLDVPVNRLLRYYTSDQNYLLLWREASTGAVHLQDNLGKRLTVYPQKYDFNDTFFVAFSQSKVKRSLVLKNYTGEVVSGEIDITLPETSSPSNFYKRAFTI